jgi:large subunit ribosomal protein L28
MSRVCSVCGKAPQYGQNIRNQHSVGWALKAPRTKRRWLPNLQSAKVMIGDAPRHVKVCTKCLKAGKIARVV